MFLASVGICGNTQRCGDDGLDFDGNENSTAEIVL